MVTNVQVMAALAAMEKNVSRIDASLTIIAAGVEKFSPVDKPLWSCDFTQGFGDFGVQEKVPGRATIIDTDRGKAARLHTEPGDSQVFGSGENERCDLRLSQELSDGFEGRESWWKLSFFLPDDFDMPLESRGTAWNWVAVSGFHNTADDGVGQGNFTTFVYPPTAIAPDRPTGITFRGYGGSPPVEFKASVGPAVKGVWYDEILHTRWSSGTDGIFDAWINGAKKLTHRGATLYPGQGVYLKLALYHPASGRPSSIIHGRVVRGKTAASVYAGVLE